MRELTGGRGAELVLEAVGRPEAWELAVAMAAPGGTVNLFGGCARDTTFTVPTARVHYEQVTLLGTYHHAPRYLARALDVLAAGEHPWAALVGPGDHARAAPGSTRRPAGRLAQVQCANGAVSGFASSASHSASSSGCGRSRSPSTVQMKPNGSAPALTQRCGANGGVSHEIERVQVHDLIADQRAAVAARREDDVDVRVLLQAREAAGRDLEVAHLERHAGLGRAHQRVTREPLPRHPARRSGVVLVRARTDALPAERGGVERRAPQARTWTGCFTTAQNRYPASLKGTLARCV